MMVGLGVEPWMGIGVRLLTSNLIFILMFGLILWFVGTGIFWYVLHTREVSKEQHLPLAIFVWTVQFLTFYVVSVLVTGALTKH
jgi:hypothetical protein